MIKKIYICK